MEVCGACETEPLEKKEKFLRTMLDILGSDLNLITNFKEEQVLITFQKILKFFFL